jgi:hypothetical protein
VKKDQSDQTLSEQEEVNLYFNNNNNKNLISKRNWKEYIGTK